LAAPGESEYIVNKLQVQLEKLGSEKKSLLREKSDLQKQVSDLGQAVDKLNRDKVQLEQEMEMEVGRGSVDACCQGVCLS
jgi:coiled-coil domain-containing protein 6